MKNNYRRLKLLALLIILIASCFLAIRARAGNSPTSLAFIYPQQEITGKVINEEGNPLSGVTVFIRGQNKGTITDLSGSYSIKAGAGDILVFSYIGYKTREVPVGKHSHIDVKLESATTSLNAVKINAGYYSTTERESTGNISRVKGKEIEMQPVVSPIQALQGRMAGVEVIPNGNFPGSASTIRIRGINSLREEGNYPLYIIDGVPVNSSPIGSNSDLKGPGIDPLNTLNLSNIESIEVLKDADATAIYGSRGANGVVLITTKQGKEGKTQLTARLYTGASKVPNRVDVLNTEQYLQVRRKAFENDGVEPTESNAFDLLLWDSDRYTDWQDYLFGGTSSITNINLDLSGGNENTSFRLGGSYQKQGTVYPGDFSYRKMTGNFSLQHTSENKKLSLDLSVNYGLDDNDLVGNVGLSSNAFILPPNAPSIFLEDGSLNWEDWALAGWGNPLKGYYNASKTQSNNLITGLVASFEILKGLKIKTNAGYTNFNSREIVKMPRRSFNPAGWGSLDHRSIHLQNFRKSWILEPQLVYDGMWGKAKLDALVGTTFQESEYETLGFQGVGYVTESLIGELSAAENLENGANDLTTYKYNAIFGRLGFNWDQKYFLNLTGRRDGSSRFGPGNQWANFWAVGSAWIFTNENFFGLSKSFLSFGKIRASYGTTGNDQIGDYGYLDAYEATMGAGGLYPTQLANPDYSWETNKKLEAALELSFFKNHLDLDLSWYRNRSSNQLVGYPLPAITGFTTVQANLPATVENQGWEIEIASHNIHSQNFQWQTSLNVSFPENKLVKYPGLEQSSYANTYSVGHPLNISLMYQYLGIDPETGFYQVKDVNDDGSFDYKDQVAIQKWDPDFFGGINNNLTYKNFSLQFLWQFVKQKGSFDLLNAGEVGVQSTQVLNENIGLQKISQSYEAGTAYSRAMTSAFAIVDASFLRLKNISFTYKIPGSVSKYLRLQNARIFLTGQNLLTLTDYEGLDPESPGGGTSFGSLRTITAGLQLQF